MMKNRTVYLAIGIITIGLFFLIRSFFAPLSDELKTAAVTMEQIFTYSAIALGAVVTLFYYQFGKIHRLLGMIIGSSIFLLGILLVFKPTIGTDLINGLMALLLVASGVYKLWYARRILDRKLQIATGGAALVSISVAITCVVYFFTTAKYELLTFLIIDFIMGGVLLWHLSNYHLSKAKENT